MLGETVATAIERIIIGRTRVRQIEVRKVIGRGKKSAVKTYRGWHIEVHPALNRTPARVTLLRDQQPGRVIVIVEDEMSPADVSAPLQKVDIDRAAVVVNFSEATAHVVRRLQGRPLHDSAEDRSPWKKR